MRWLQGASRRAMSGGAILVLAATLSVLQPVESEATLQRPAPKQATQQQGAAPLLPLPRGGGFSASVELVRVPIIVIDSKGAFIGHLAPSNFTVHDNGKTYRVEYFVSDEEPATVGIVVDASDAMVPYIDGVRAGIMRLVNNLRPDDETFLISYGTAAEVLLPRTSDKSALALALAGYAPQGADRALFDAVELGLDALENATYDKRSLILVGAGADTASGVGELTLQQDIRRLGISIHAIVLDERPEGDHAEVARVNRAQTLPEIVRFTGGLLAQRPANVERFGSISGWLEIAGGDISAYVKHQYLLHYSPLSPPRPGIWRSIRVSLDVDYKVLRARSGYTR